jgi:hypothetical protein
MKTIREVIFKMVVLSILWFGAAIFLLWDMIFNDKGITIHILECWEGIGGCLGIMFFGLVFLGLIVGPILLIAIVWAYIKDPDAPWRSDENK